MRFMKVVYIGQLVYETILLSTNLQTIIKKKTNLQ
jgi:hypothetical protein